MSTLNDINPDDYPEPKDFSPSSKDKILKIMVKRGIHHFDGEYKALLASIAYDGNIEILRGNKSGDISVKILEGGLKLIEEEGGYEELHRQSILLQKELEIDKSLQRENWLKAIERADQAKTEAGRSLKIALAAILVAAASFAFSVARWLYEQRWFQ